MPSTSRSILCNAVSSIGSVRSLGNLIKCMIVALQDVNTFVRGGESKVAEMAPEKYRLGLFSGECN